MADTLTSPVTTAPVTPAPAPAAAPAPSPAPSVDIKSSGFSQLDARARTAPAKVEAAPKDGEKKPDAAPVEDKTKTTVAPSKEDRTARDPKWYRDEHARMKTETEKTVARIKELEAKIATGNEQGKDMSVLSQRLAEREKELDNLRGELRAAKQEVSPEFKEKWDKPFNDSAAFAKNMIEQLGVASEDGTQRQATWNDFAALYQMPINKAAQAARQMFGDDAAIVIGQLTELHKLDYQRGNALEGEKARWKESATREEAESIQRKQGFNAMKSEVEKHLAETNPDFQDKPGDEGKESRELRQQGYELFDGKPKDIKEAAIKTAYVRHIVAAHYPLIRERDGLRSKVGELEKTVAELRGNKPGPSDKTGADAGAASSGESWMDDLRKTVPAGG